MIRFAKETFVGLWKDLPPSFLFQIDRMFGRIYDRSDLIALEVREFVDASSGAKSRYLPSGVLNPDKDYYFQKSDSSGNAVTIIAYGSEKINGSSTYVLAAQYDSVYLMWDSDARTWHKR